MSSRRSSGLFAKAFMAYFPSAYLEHLTMALYLKATVRKNTNVLDHIMGYFKKQLTAGEKIEMKGLIGDYHMELVPYYLHPHPSELKLRNHV